MFTTAIAALFYSRSIVVIVVSLRRLALLARSRDVDVTLLSSRLSRNHSHLPYDFLNFFVSRVVANDVMTP